MSLSQRSFDTVTRLFQQVSGIQLSEAKRQLVVGRLQRLAAERGHSNLDLYVDELARGDDPAEVVKVIDRLTTNETYFFREPQHFDYLAAMLQRKPPAGEFRVWSAASSSGEEAYSIAMLLAETLGDKPWSVFGTDLSTQVVDSARRALYTMERARNVPMEYLKRYCLKGLPPYAEHMRVGKALRARVRFETGNLMQPLPDIGLFDVIFLRNVLIYFDPPAKREIVLRVLGQLKPAGLLFTGHSESLANYDLGLKALQPAVYVRE